MPWSAFPEHLNSPEKVEAAFPDDSQYGDSWFGRLYRAYQKKTKPWFAFSFRCTEWWAKWRPFPKVLFAVGGEGPWRWVSIKPAAIDLPDFSFKLGWNDNPAFYYLSRIQSLKRWHFAVQWPLMVSFHFYPKGADVPVGAVDNNDLDGKLWFGYWNHFDADLIYWMVTSVYLGRNWK